MKIPKKYIIILAIISLIVFVGVVIGLNNKKINKKELVEKENEILKESEIQKMEEENDTNDLQEVTSDSKYYAVTNIVDTFFKGMEKFKEGYSIIISGVSDENVLKEESEGEIAYTRETLKKQLEIYIKENNLTDKELENMYKKYAGNNFAISKMYQKNITQNIKCFLIEGILSSNNQEYKMVIVVDEKNMTYTIYPMEYLEKTYGKSYNINTIQLSMTEISNNKSNTFKYETYTEQEIANKYVHNFMFYMNKGENYVYDLLDNEYREKRFGNLENFKEYIKQSSYLKNLKMNDYQFDEDENKNKILVCRDIYENYYIFKIKAVMDYTVIIDNHTIDLPQFKEKYTMAKDKNKIAMNVEKIKDAINTQDYSYIYEKLNMTFRNNNYQTQKKFETDIKEKIYEHNNFEYNKIEEQDGIYIIDITVKDQTGENDFEKKLTIVMQLKANENYEISLAS